MCTLPATDFSVETRGDGPAAMRCSPQKIRRAPLEPPTRAARERRAVTIVELVIVLLIMSIMAAAAVPTFFESLLHQQVEAAARRVKADLELVRNTARLTSAAQSLSFSGMSYTLSAEIVGLDDPNERYAVDLSMPPYEVGAVRADFDSTQEVTFNGYGVPSSGGTVILKCGGHQATVSLDGTTGDVAITSIHSLGVVAENEN